MTSKAINKNKLKNLFQRWSSTQSLADNGGVSTQQAMITESKLAAQKTSSLKTKKSNAIHKIRQSVNLDDQSPEYINADSGFSDSSKSTQNIANPKREASRTSTLDLSDTKFAADIDGNSSRTFGRSEDVTAPKKGQHPGGNLKASKSTGRVDVSGTAAADKKKSRNFFTKLLTPKSKKDSNLQREIGRVIKALI